ncbi:MAG: TerB family tellurite resistance protein [Gammaproteobacteria bacterium]
MLATLKSLLRDSIGQPEAQTEEQLQEQLQLAITILLLEVDRTDHEIEEVEVERIKMLVKDKFNLTNEATQALMDEADDTINDIIDFHQFTSLLNQHFDLDQKCRLVQYMWEIALADGNLDAYEDQFIRKVADLMYLRHSELLSARERAKKAM